MKLKIEKEEFVNKTFRFNINLVKQMEEICEEKGISLNKFIDICVRYSIENLDEDEKARKK